MDHSTAAVTRIAAAIAALLWSAAALRAQGAAAPGDSGARGYMARYQEIAHLAPLPAEVAQVTHLVLTRDAGQLVLEHGTLVLLSPVGGRTVGAVFEGEGRFVFAPADRVEQAELRRFADTTELDAPFTEAVLLFADSTADQLRALPFALGAVPDGADGHVRDLIGSLKGTQDGSFAAEVAEPLLDRVANGLFLARVVRRRGGPVLFEYDPGLSEAVHLFRPASRRRTGASWAVVTQFAPRTAAWGAGPAWDFRQRLQVVGYRMDVRITESFGADLNLAAGATLTLFARDDVGPWLRFSLDSRLTADSARWGSGPGASAPFFKARDDEVLWVRAPRGLEAGDSAALTIYYHGDMVKRYANMFFIDPGAEWYPINQQGSRTSTFDVTFRSPARYPLVSIGTRTDSSLADNVVTTHWVASRPTPYATFNLGLFENYHAGESGAFPVDVLYSDEAHRAIRQIAAKQGEFVIEQGDKPQRVADDVSNALALFTALFGACPFTHFYASEIPYPEGVSFPGMIDFSFATFQNTSLDGFDEYFRAHETAHQWWGNGVLPGSYRDAWLSEGLAAFSALWYLQAARKHSDEYFHFLDQYRTDIESVRSDAGPIWTGDRASREAAPQGYEVMTYEKGAWVLNMLRVLMLDLRTMSDDGFIATLRDYFQAHDGSPASTGDFQRVVEQHVGMSMEWFFDEWVKGTGIPTYRVAWTSQSQPDGRFRVRLRVRQEGVDAAFHMPVLVAADLGGGRTAHFRVDVRGDQTEYVSPLLPAEPRSVAFDDLHAVLADVKTEAW